LRIGSFVYDKGTNHLVEIYHIDTDSDGRNRINYIGIENYESIPLTKEWLLQFGFKQYNPKDEANSTDLNSRIFYTVIEDKQFEIAYDFGIVKKLLLRFREGDLYVIYKMDMKYVHQLQNLYFALTGKELIIKQ
jgi:hypothetical protein